MPVSDQPVSGIHQAVFGEVTEDDVTAWLDRHLRQRLAAGVQQVLVRTGRLAAVYGLRLTDGTEVVAKVHRGNVGIRRLAAAVACQRILAAAGFPCPKPLDGPVATGPRVVVLESWLDAGEVGDAHQPAIRRSMAQALAQQMKLLGASRPQQAHSPTHPPGSITRPGPGRSPTAPSLTSPSPHPASNGWTTSPRKPPTRSALAENRR
jgi:Phosphotransferase enzyme family